MRATRWWLVLNGKAAVDDAVREAVRRAREGGEVHVRLTWERGDAARYVREAIDAGAEVVIAGGGDGTLSDVAAALAEFDMPADALPSLGLLPLGTANDFATAAEMPVDPDDAFAVIRSQVPQPIDLLRIQAETDDEQRVDWCANLASGGFGTQVTVETDEGLKKMLGGLAYLVTGIARLGRIESIEARMIGPGYAWEGAFLALGLGNGRQAGGGQVLCPDAVINDARLDLTIVPALEGELGATVATLVTEGRDAALERIALRERLPWLHIDADQPITLNLDGESISARRFQIECVPGRLRMHLPAGSPLLAPPGTPIASASDRDPDPPPALLPA